MIKVVASILCAAMFVLSACGPVRGQDDPRQKDVKGEVTLVGEVGGREGALVLSLGANHAHFLLNFPKKQVGEKIRPGKWCEVKGILRRDKKDVPSTLVLDVSEAKAVKDYTDDSIRGTVEFRGLLTKDAWPGPHYTWTAELKDRLDAYLLSDMPGFGFCPVHFGGSKDVARKAEALYGRAVAIRAEVEGFNLGVRGQTFLYTITDVAPAQK